VNEYFKTIQLQPSQDAALIPGATLMDALLIGRDHDEVAIPGTGGMVVRLDGLRELLKKQHNLTPEQFAALSPGQANHIVRTMARDIKREYKRTYPDKLKGAPAQDADEEVRQKARNVLHHELRPWAAGPLTLQKPQGSSYHHLIAYDTKGIHRRKITDIHKEHGGEPELLVVENDWAKALAGKDDELGEVLMPFPFAVWEFRITDVRVLFFVRVDEKAGSLAIYATYGKHGDWVSDDYIWYSDGTGRIAGTPITQLKLKEYHGFERVIKFCWMQVRAACILMDVGATRRELVVASRRLVERQLSSGKQPPRDYQVVRIFNDRAKVKYAKGRTTANGQSRSPQGGHLRRGTWVHYDDQDSGDVQYVNDGGFVVSKSWRKWHWAGDLTRMIEREYRL
jgi:hypothetical protein